VQEVDCVDQAVTPQLSTLGLQVTIRCKPELQAMDILEAVKSIKDEGFQDKFRKAVACVSRTIDLYG